METVKNSTVEFDYQKTLKDRNIHFVDKFIKVEKYINRPLASLIVRAVLNTKITPNGLTFTNFLLGILAAFLFSRGEYVYFILGGISIQLSAIVDCADGMLARAKDMCSDYGALLDLFLDRITDFCLVVGITLGMYSVTSSVNLLILGLLTAGLVALQANLFYITKRLIKNDQTGETGEVRALMLLLTMIFGLTDTLEFGIYLMLTAAIINTVSSLINFIRLGKKL